MAPPAWRRFVHAIVNTDDDEISCAECFDLVSEYVELEAAGTAGVRTMPHLQRHLMHCGVCREEYEVLRDLVRSEAEG
jgi:hypothetical protein